jgi:hypothetical protein
MMEFESFSIKDQKVWDKWVAINTDGYDGEVVRYAAAWAHRMEERMAQGEKLEAVAKEASREADTNGITGFMYGVAVSVLTATWEYGEALRQWHNLDTQIKNESEEANAEGGVLNPVILTVGQ